MKRMRRYLFVFAVATLLSGASTSFAETGCHMVLDKKTGEYKYCCPSGCIWV